jgi:DNA-directed RNA polymerase subunit RPC12/RpoP
MPCPYCGATTGTAALFCGSCGNPLAAPDDGSAEHRRECPECGSRYPAYMRFCVRDGSTLGEASG